VTAGAGGDSAAIDAGTLREQRSLWREAWRTFQRHRPAMFGLVALGSLALAVAVGPFIYTEPINNLDFTRTVRPPSPAHPFGTDELGRDLLARTLYGGRISIAVGVTAMFVAITVGVTIGALAGFFPRADGPLMRLTELMISMPTLPLLLLVLLLFRDPLRSAFGPTIGIFVLIVSVIGLLNWMTVARLVRAAFLSTKQLDYVTAARSIGAGNLRLIVRHILPNVMSSIVVAATIAVGAAIITESTLSFLGLGFPPDEPTWGRLLFDAQNLLDSAPHLALFPGALIFIAVISINYIGDGLRDTFDPRRVD